jgi:hypothetical protein
LKEKSALNTIIYSSDMLPLDMSGIRTLEIAEQSSESLAANTIIGMQLYDIYNDFSMF